MNISFAKNDLLLYNNCATHLTKEATTALRKVK